VNSKIESIQSFLQGQKVTWEPEAGHTVYWAPTADLKVALPLDEAGELKTTGAVTFEPGRIGKAASFDGKSFLDAGYTADFDIEDHFSISAWVYSDAVPSGAVVSRMTDTAKGRGYGVYLNNGKVFVHLTSVWADDAFRLETNEPLTAGKWHHLAVTYNGSRLAEGVQVFVDGKQAQYKIEQDNLYRPFHNAGKAFKEPLRIGGGAGPERRFRGRIDDVRLYGRVIERQEIDALALGESINDIAAKPERSRSEIENLQLRSYYLENAAPQKVRAAWNDLIRMREEKEKIERGFSTVMVMAERPQRKDTFVLARGAYNVPGEKVEPGVPAVLPPLPAGAPNNRLGFAQWLVDPGNPLLARVTVNRFWQMYFGTGIVKTTEDFGVQGEWPSHPELLDWLATEFIRTGWDEKALQKLIVTSATYRQSSEVSPELEQRDPENRLLARAPRFRLPAEMIRDQALFASGLLA